MSKLFINILTPEERQEFPKLRRFSDIGVLAGGTALALQIKHRRSYDLDVFLKDALPSSLSRTARAVFGKITIINQYEEELTFTTASNLKITFVYYPFRPLYTLIDTESIALFSWKDIALDKAYTIGRMAQYRDYVDLFWLMKIKKMTLEWLMRNASKKFGDLFPEKIFLSQLTYFDDLASAPIEFLGTAHTRGEIKAFFEEKVTQFVENTIRGSVNS